MKKAKFYINDKFLSPTKIKEVNTYQSTKAAQF